MIARKRSGDDADVLSWNAIFELNRILTRPNARDWNETEVFITDGPAQWMFIQSMQPYPDHQQIEVPFTIVDMKKNPPPSREDKLAAFLLNPVRNEEVKCLVLATIRTKSVKDDEKTWAFGALIVDGSHKGEFLVGTYQHHMGHGQAIIVS